MNHFMSGFADELTKVAEDGEGMSLAKSLPLALLMIGAGGLAGKHIGGRLAKPHPRPPNFMNRSARGAGARRAMEQYRKDVMSWRRDRGGVRRRGESHGGMAGGVAGLAGALHLSKGKKKNKGHTKEAISKAQFLRGVAGVSMPAAGAGALVGGGVGAAREGDVKGALKGALLGGLLGGGLAVPGAMGGGLAGDAAGRLPALLRRKALLKKVMKETPQRSGESAGSYARRIKQKAGLGPISKRKKEHRSREHVQKYWGSSNGFVPGILGGYTAGGLGGGALGGMAATKKKDKKDD